MVLAARGPNGRNVVGVSVTVDGGLVVEALDGKALEVDPGLHKFVFEMSGSKPIEQEVVIREREKGRAVMVQFRDEAASARSTTPLAVPVGLTAAGVVGWGVGVVALGAATYFWIKRRPPKPVVVDAAVVPGGVLGGLVGTF